MSKQVKLSYDSCSRWDVKDVADWLEYVELEKAIPYFTAERMDGLALIQLTKERVQKIVGLNKQQKEALQRLLDEFNDEQKKEEKKASRKISTRALLPSAAADSASTNDDDNIRRNDVRTAQQLLYSKPAVSSAAAATFAATTTSSYYSPAAATHHEPFPTTATAAAAATPVLVAVSATFSAASPTSPNFTGTVRPNFAANFSASNVSTAAAAASPTVSSPILPSSFSPEPGTQTVPSPILPSEANFVSTRQNSNPVGPNSPTQNVFKPAVPPPNMIRPNNVVQKTIDVVSEAPSQLRSPAPPTRMFKSPPPTPGAVRLPVAQLTYNPLQTTSGIVPQVPPNPAIIKPPPPVRGVSIVGPVSSDPRIVKPPPPTRGISSESAVLLSPRIISPVLPGLGTTEPCSLDSEAVRPGALGPHMLKPTQGFQRFQSPVPNRTEVQTSISTTTAVVTAAAAAKTEILHTTNEPAISSSRQPSSTGLAPRLIFSGTPLRATNILAAGPASQASATADADSLASFPLASPVTAPVRQQSATSHFAAEAAAATSTTTRLPGVKQSSLDSSGTKTDVGDDDGIYANKSEWASSNDSQEDYLNAAECNRIADTVVHSGQFAQEAKMPDKAQSQRSLIPRTDAPMIQAHISPFQSKNAPVSPQSQIGTLKVPQSPKTTVNPQPPTPTSSSWNAEKTSPGGWRLPSPATLKAAGGISRQSKSSHVETPLAERSSQHNESLTTEEPQEDYTNATEWVKRDNVDDLKQLCSHDLRRDDLQATDAAANFTNDSKSIPISSKCNNNLSKSISVPLPPRSKINPPPSNNVLSPTERKANPSQSHNIPLPVSSNSNPSQPNTVPRPRDAEATSLSTNLPLPPRVKNIPPSLNTDQESRTEPSPTNIIPLPPRSMGFSSQLSKSVSWQPLKVTSSKTGSSELSDESRTSHVELERRKSSSEDDDDYLQPSDSCASERNGVQKQREKSNTERESNSTGSKSSKHSTVLEQQDIKNSLSSQITSRIKTNSTPPALPPFREQNLSSMLSETSDYAEPVTSPSSSSSSSSVPTKSAFLKLFTSTKTAKEEKTSSKPAISNVQRQMSEQVDNFDSSSKADSLQRSWGSKIKQVISLPRSNSDSTKKTVIVTSPSQSAAPSSSYVELEPPITCKTSSTEKSKQRTEAEISKVERKLDPSEPASSDKVLKMLGSMFKTKNTLTSTTTSTSTSKSTSNSITSNSRTKPAKLISPTFATDTPPALPPPRVQSSPSRKTSKKGARNRTANCDEEQQIDYELVDDWTPELEYEPFEPVEESPENDSEEAVTQDISDSDLRTSIQEGQELQEDKDSLIYETFYGESEDVLNTYPWFFGNVARQETTAKLSAMTQDGSFLIRKSAHGKPEQPFTLCIRYEQQTLNIPIRQRTADNLFAIGSEKPQEKTYTTLSEIVELHREFGLELQRKDGVTGTVTLKQSPKKS